MLVKEQLKAIHALQADYCCCRISLWRIPNFYKQNVNVPNSRPILSLFKKAVLWNWCIRPCVYSCKTHLRRFINHTI